MRGEVRRSIVLAVAGLLGGFAMVVALFGTGELLKRNAAGNPASEAPADPSSEKRAGGGTPSGTPLAALPAPPQGESAVAGGPALGAAATPAEAAGAPTFDIVRVENDGASVIAGRAAPKARVELLRDGRPFASTVADEAGQFAVTPPDLPAGSSEIALSAAGPDGKPLRGRESVTVVVAEKRDARPLIALSAPDAPTRVLSQPGAPEAPVGGKPATAFAEIPGAAVPEEAKGRPAPEPREAAARPDSAPKNDPTARDTVPVRIVSVDAQEGGRLDVTGQASPDSALRLYLNDTMVASGRAGPDGRIAFTIGRGVRPGAYQIRIDSVDPDGGKVKRRAEVAFAYPESVGSRVAGAGKPAAERKPAGEAAAKAPATSQPSAAPETARSAPPAVPDPRQAAAPAARNAPAPPRSEAAEPRRAEAPPTERRPAGQAPETAPAPSLAAPPAAPKPASPGREASAAGTPSVAASAGAGAPNPGKDDRAAAALSPVLPGAAGPSGPPAVPAPKQAAGRIAEPEQGSTGTAAGDRPGAVFVPEVGTARITRGDSLWQISRRTYGKGNRYTVIYDANQDQIRNPDRIYPGQIFVLPKDMPASNVPAPKRT